jgi:Na+-driven multidrug efflux pump
MPGGDIVALALFLIFDLVVIVFLAPAAVASIGQALGDDSLKDAKKHANAALRLGLLAGVLFSVLPIRK